MHHSKEEDLSFILSNFQLRTNTASKVTEIWKSDKIAQFLGICAALFAQFEKQNCAGWLKIIELDETKFNFSVI